MDGENKQPPADAAPQPGGRSPAPGALALVQAFINTHYDLEFDHGAELLDSPAALAGWLAGAGLIKTPALMCEADLQRALSVRESLRTLAGTGSRSAAASGACLQALNAAADGAPVEVRFGSGRPQFVASPDGGVPSAIGVLLAVTAQALVDGSWSRLKVCPGEDCGWAFYDHSRNRSGRWCSMSVCGGRAKARTHYQRRRAREL
jgi:predicted RNA-binding Zn ribbon-like protein